MKKIISFFKSLKSNNNLDTININRDGIVSLNYESPETIRRLHIQIKKLKNIRL